MEKKSTGSMIYLLGIFKTTWHDKLDPVHFEGLLSGHGLDPGLLLSSESCPQYLTSGPGVPGGPLER